MGVGADHQRRAPVEMMAERLLLARRLGMDVDDHRVGLLAERAGGELAVDRGEGIVERVHEHPAHDVDDEHPRPVPGEEDAGAAPGRAGGIVGRPEEPLLVGGEGQRLALVEDVVAGGDHVGPGIEEGAEHLLGDAEAAGGVLAVDHDEIEPVARRRGPAAAG